MSKGTQALALIALAILQLIWYGWVLQALWGWFVAPTFNIAALTLIQALGIALIVRMLTTNQGQSDSKSKDAIAVAAVNGFIYPLIMLAMGWVYSWFL